MNSVWFSSDLSQEIIKNDDIFEQTESIVADILSKRIDMATLVENLGGVLTNQDVEYREKGMRFFTKVLKEVPKQMLNAPQVKFVSIFYVDRLKDNHRVIPPVLEGYLALIDMVNYDVKSSADFFLNLFKEVPCQSQMRQDRYNIYSIIQKLMDKDLQFIKSLGPDFIYGVITMMDGERDPRNLLFLFSFLPKLISQVPLGHLAEEMFDVISCYYPIDFHPNPDDPAAVSRDDLAKALLPCLCATPEYGELCLVLLLEKLDSSLRVAKLDSLNLLTESCKTFNAESYGPFVKALWSSIHREILNKTDDSLKMAAHEALSALVKKLSTTANTDHVFETFIEGIIISMQSLIAESTTVQQFIQATKVLLTTGNACKESCIIITGTMIPATIRFYSFKKSLKLQICSLDFLGDLYDIAKYWEVLDKIKNQVEEIPQHCLTAVSEPIKDYQVAGFRTLIKVIDFLPEFLVVAFVEVLCHNVQYAHDTDLLCISVQTVHHIAMKYPELIMNLVVKGKCDLNNVTADKTALQERLNLLCNLLSIDDFTEVIIQEMLKLISSNDEEAPKVIEAMSESMSNYSLYSAQKLTQIESDHNLINSVVAWLMSEIESSSQEALSHGYVLTSNTMSSLTPHKQEEILKQHTKNVIDKCDTNEIYFLILESLYNSVHQSIHNEYYPDILNLSLKLSLTSNSNLVSTRACALLAHFLNKAEYGPNFETLYESLRSYLASCSTTDRPNCSKLIILYGWITKALVMRGHDGFLFWLQKIILVITNLHYCKFSAAAIKLIMSNQEDSFSPRQHCRINLLYKQRMVMAFSELVAKLPPIPAETKECYLLSWGYVLGKAPKSLLNADIEKIAPLVIDSLCYDNQDLLLVMIDVLSHYVQSAHVAVAGSLQTVLPRLVKLSRYPKSMDVRIKSLQCLYDIANAYRTALLLPFKQDILLDLGPSLDDKKRLVRNAAVRARTRWFLIGAPGEAKVN